ncbi:hypothetical protein V1264_014020 [Littorina saxatilis]|uniref:adenylate cyclase n=1 Tax=Littorina saxatilis TaxID=31220 RepID=A0AAN9BQX5_9CAEN
MNRAAADWAGLRPKKLSFKGVSSCVIRLMQSVKFNAEIPFSDVLTPSREERTVPHRWSLVATVTDKLRNPFKDRVSTSAQPMDRVNKYLAQALVARSIEQEKSNHVNFITLRFKDATKEDEYQEAPDFAFSGSLVCCMLLLMCMAGLQTVILPRTLLLLMLFLAGFTWIAIVLILILSVKIKCTTFDIRKSSALRMFVIITTVSLIYIVAQVNVMCCSGGKIFAFLADVSMTSLNMDHHLSCEFPSYVYISGLLCLVGVAAFLKLSALVKLILMCVMSATFIFMMVYTHVSIFLVFDHQTHPVVPTHVVGIVTLIIFTIGLYVQGRQQEWTNRLDFLWKIQATEEKSEMVELQNSNRRILCNLLPTHVAAHFIDNHHSSAMQELYSQQYSKAAVFFASIPNFSDFYMELDANNQGVECLRVLNEIIADFDEILDEPQFQAVDKIKTIGSTYMGAVGLMPHLLIEDTETSTRDCLVVLVEFVFAMKDKLRNINENSYNNFTMKVGINIGPVVAGVIGARKPQYDIWGNTVNVASRMESTGKPEHIQVTEEVYSALADVYDFRCRGRVAVKGKGEMITYFLLSRKPLEVGPLGCSGSGPFSDRRSPMTPESPSLVRPSSRQSWDSGHLPRHGSGNSIRQGSLTSQGKGQGYGTVTGLERPPSLDSGRGNLGTPTGSLNKKRQSSLDSPRNTSRKLSGSSGTNSLSNENQGSGEPPELPAIHFMNIKMHGSGTGTPPGRVRQNMVQNALFDSLKENNTLTHHNHHSPASPPFAAGSGMYGPRGEEGGSAPTTPFGRQMPSPSTSSAGKTSLGSSIQPIRRVNSDLAAKPPTPPTSFSSPLNLACLQGMSSTSSGHYQQIRPSVLAGSPSPRQPALKPVQEDVIPEDPVLAINQDIDTPVKELPVKEIVPPARNGGMRDHGRAVLRSNSKSSNGSGRESLNSPPDVNGNGCGGGGGGGVRGHCSASPQQQQQQRRSCGNEIDNDEEMFVTGVYREPIDRSHSATPSQNSNASSCKAGATSHNGNGVQGSKKKSPSPTKPGAAPRPLSDVQRRSSSGSKESNSSGSTMTPTTSALVVSIDGKMMSILPQGQGGGGGAGGVGAGGELPLPIRRVNADDLSSSPATNGIRAELSKPRLMMSPKAKRQSFPITSSSYMKRDLTSYSSFTGSDDERDSISSRQMSDHSSIVLLQPIHLKPSKAANVRHLGGCGDNNNRPDLRNLVSGGGTGGGRSEADMLSYIFGSPFHSLDRYRSRSSDTINSMPRCPPTPKFPVPSNDSSSLTQLLQELAGESSAVAQEITPSVRQQGKRGADPDTVATTGDRGQGSGSSPKVSRSSAGLRGGLFKQGSAQAEAERKRRHRHSAQPGGVVGGGVGQRVPLTSQYQVKRRTSYTMPPRHCRSLDYIPSDREDGSSHISSNASSACGSPKAMYQRNSYLLPLIFGKHQAPPPTSTDNVSVSSLASSSEMSRSDPAINAHDYSSAAYESEYDNYRPGGGTTSDEDFYVPDPISDADIDLFDVDDIDVEDVTVSDHFSMDMPVPRFQKKITDV